MYVLLVRKPEYADGRGANGYADYRWLFGKCQDEIGRWMYIHIIMYENESCNTCIPRTRSGSYCRFYTDKQYYLVIKSKF